MPATGRPAARAAATLLLAADIPVEVTRKDIRTLRLQVHAPDGRVTLSAPAALPWQAIDRFVSGRLEWIRKHRRRIAALEFEPAYRFLDGERHWFAGRRYALEILERPASPRVELGADTLVMRVRPGSDAGQRRALLDAWYRTQLRARVPGLIDAYQPRMGVTVRQFGIRRMRTRWGTCNPRARRIWLGLELARTPPGCLEYVVVHEMAHLLEPRHNARFHGLMDAFLPAWREHRETLNRFPRQP